MRVLILAGAMLAAGATLAVADPAPAPATAPVPVTTPAATAPAPAPATTASAEDAKKKARDQQVICEEELDTGSRLHKHRICMTRADRDKKQQDARDAMQGVFDTERGVLPPKQGIN